MAQTKDVQLSYLVDPHDHDGVLEEILRIHGYHYLPESTFRIQLAYQQARSLFAGEFPGYRACLAEYHDFSHTMQVVLACARLLDGYNLSRPGGASMPEGLAAELLLAAFLHDTGYIQEEWDTQGTGAKYSSEHEERSVAFLKRHAEVFEIEPQELPPMTRFIQSTDLKLEIESLPFASEQERDGGSMLASADIMGQMADREYLEKLLFLYYEFREAGVPGYETEFDVLRRTRTFYEVVKRRLRERYRHMYELAHLHFRERYGVNENLYVVAIDRQMSYLDRIMADSSTNFRHKLRRGDQKRLQGSGRPQK
jgi:hypothetical protein